MLASQRRLARAQHLHLVVEAVGDLADLGALALLERGLLGAQVLHARMALAVLGRQLGALAVELDLARAQLVEHRRLQHLRRLVEVGIGVDQPLHLTQPRLGRGALAAGQHELRGQPRELLLVGQAPPRPAWRR